MEEEGTEEQEEDEEEAYEFEPDRHESGETHPTPGPPQSDLQRIETFLHNLEHFMDELFADPPTGLRGEWLDEQRRAWNEISPGPKAERGTDVHKRYRLSTTIADEPNATSKLDAHGLTGQPMATKLGEFRDKVNAFLQLRNVRRASYALRTAGVVVESVLDAIPGVGGAYKEAVKGLHHLTEIAIEEGS